MIRFFFEDARVDPSFLTGVKQWLSQVASLEHFTIHELNYIFGSDQYLLSVNQKYLQHDYFTDIITFDQRDDSSLPLEGDIFISVERVKDNALMLNQSFQHELLRVIVHGLLHLLGYSDSNDELKTQMRCLEDKYLHLHNEIQQ